jgi:hypothetical protein
VTAGAVAARWVALAAGLGAAVALGHHAARADQLPGPSFDFSTGAPNGQMAMASCPSCVSGSQEIEAADDFILPRETALTSATFTGLLPLSAPLSNVTRVRVEIYRVFPTDSDTGRMITVPTRNNSPADVEFANRDTDSGSLSFTDTLVTSIFTAANSVLNGINKSPNQTTGGEGSRTGEEVQFSVTFTTPIDLPADHYFFVPQVELSSGNFFWLSGPRPTSPPFTGDLQAWIRNTNLEPDWLRVGTDIVGGATPPTFNGSFSLHGNAVCAVTITPSALPGAAPGVPYSAAFSATGAQSPFTFTETGPLPAGLSFGPDGSLSGTPTQLGSFPITVTAMSPDGCGANEQLTLTVSSSPSATKAILSSLAETNSAFVVGNASTPLTAQTAATRHKKGTVFSFDLDQPATVKIAIKTRVPGRRVGHACRPNSPKLRHKPRCTRTITVATLTRTAHAGLNKVPFTGRVRGRALKPARYRAVFIAIDSAGASSPQALRFRVVKR